MLELATLHSFWFIFGLSIGVVGAVLLMLLATFLDDKPREARKKKEIDEARKEGYSLARDWTIGEKLYLENEIDNLWYEVEELQSKFERLSAPTSVMDLIGRNKDDF